MCRGSILRTEEVSMSHGLRMRRGWVVPGLFAAGLLSMPSTVAAQTASQARVVRMTLAGTSVLGIPLPGTTTVLADTGSLPLGVTGALQASSVAESVPTVLSAESLHATTIGVPDQASSEASLGSLAIFVAGNTITADFIFARARAVTGTVGSAESEMYGLVINGDQVAVSGAPNQSVPIIGGRVILNEVQRGPGGATINALHVILTGGVADIVVATATAAIP
jgi:hypothetical protein